jgi:hypothetical protein
MCERDEPVSCDVAVTREMLDEGVGVLSSYLLDGRDFATVEAVYIAMRRLEPRQGRGASHARGGAPCDVSKNAR